MTAVKVFPLPAILMCSATNVRCLLKNYAIEGGAGAWNGLIMSAALGLFVL